MPINVTMAFMAKTPFLKGYVEELARRNASADIYGFFMSGEISRRTPGVKSLVCPTRIRRTAVAVERIGKKVGRSSLGRYVGVHCLSRKVIEDGTLQRSDVLFCQPYFWPLVKAAKKLERPVMLECDSAHPQDLWNITRERERVNRIPRRLADPWNFWPYVKMALKSLALADKVIVLNDHARISFLNRGFPPERLCALKIPLLSPLGRPSAESEEPRFVFAANRAAGKGLDIVLAAWKRYCARGGRGHMYICGEETASFRLIYSNYEPLTRVSRLGHINLVNFLSSQRNVLLSPSFSEAGPRTVLEAMALGNPVVASKAGSADMVEHGVTGWLINSTTDGVLEGLLEVDKHWQEIKEYGARASKRVEVERATGEYFRSACDVMMALARNGVSR